jgi:hypothetical protein
MSREENLLVLFIFVQTMHFFLIQKSMSSTIKTQFFFLET